jgi:hypothetical protein
MDYAKHAARVEKRSQSICCGHLQLVYAVHSPCEDDKWKNHNKEQTKRWANHISGDKNRHDCGQRQQEKIVNRRSPIFESSKQHNSFTNQLPRVVCPGWYAPGGNWHFAGLPPVVLGGANTTHRWMQPAFSVIISGWGARLQADF